MIPLQEDEKRRTPFQLRCPLFIAVSERRRNRRIQLRRSVRAPPSTWANFFVVVIVMCSICKRAA